MCSEYLRILVAVENPALLERVLPINMSDSSARRYEYIRCRQGTDAVNLVKASFEECKPFAMAILDAGIRSANSGKLELVNNVTWCIG